MGIFFDLDDKKDNQHDHDAQNDIKEDCGDEIFCFHAHVPNTTQYTTEYSPTSTP